MYIVRKGPIAGPAMKLPFMGPFLQSVNPKFEEYYAKWVSAPLSCVSVFHKYVNNSTGHIDLRPLRSAINK